MSEDKQYFVYILRSVCHPDKTYVGMTNNIRRRLEEHNAGTQTYSHRYAPWKLITHIVFSDPTVACESEKYLKTSSGKAFTSKHLLQPAQT